MFLQKVEGDQKLDQLAVRLEREGPYTDNLFTIELLKGIRNFKFTGWEIYVFEDKIDNSENGDNDDDTLLGVVCAEHGPPFSKYIVYSKQISDTMAFEFNRYVNWSAVGFFKFVSCDFKPMLQKMGNGGTFDESACFTYMLHSLEKLQEIPEDNVGKNDYEQFELRRIGKEYVSTVNSRWKHGTELTKLMLDEEMTLGYGYGVFVDGRIVSWIIMRKFGGMGILQTLPDYRGRGYASLVVSALSRDLLALNATPFVNVEEGNIAAVKFFEKLGFVKGPDIDFVLYFPKNKDAT